MAESAGKIKIDVDKWGYAGIKTCELCDELLITSNKLYRFDIYI